MNILVCDDDKEILEAVSIYLENEGFTVFKALNGIEALQVLDEKEIHLIVMDIMMPKMDGIRATLKIREDKNIPVILLSAKSEDTDKIIGLNMGADDYITKPFNPLELIARVKSQLRRYTIDIIDQGHEVTLAIKNISAYELNIFADELMERFKRGDESRSSQGSGLGLSIAKSLIEIQKGNFWLEIDGDLFKAMIKIPRA
jgi:DNA-binding response OmpR family regulator